ncbi:Synaptonemal complex protein 2, partial [Lamprotornis superbus]
FEKLIDEATGKKDFQSLEQFLATEECENISHKCSKQFVNKLDKLLCWALDKQEFKSISTLVNAVQKCGRKISIAGEDGLPAMIKHGLGIKIDLPFFSLYMVNWFEKLKGILVLRGSEKNEMLTSLAEDFFIMLLTVCDSRPEGKMQILENFVLRTCSLITDARINIYVQQEVIKKLNLLLDKIPRDARKKILSTKEMLLVMSEMGRTILDAGDYDTQVAITEALCRMVSEKQRAVLASQWFPMEFVSTAFKGIKDSEFETDCRKFLNQVNGMLGDKRRVFTFPCLSAALDKHEIPLDENLEEFWIDFNVGSRSISFYVAAEDADHQWETVIIQEDDVSMYSLEEKDSKKLLKIDLKSPVSVGSLEGGKFLLYFDSILEIKDVIIKIYGFHKCKEFSKKQSASVAKTTVHIVFDESGSQVLVPESQLSPGLKEKSGDEEKLSKYKIQQPPGSLRTQSKNNSQEKLRGDSSKITPSRKRKVSEASVLIPGTSVSTRSPPFFVNTSTPFKGRFKLPLEMTSSTKRSDNDAINESRTKNSYQEPPGQMHSEEVLKIVQEATEKQTLGKIDTELMSHLDEVLDIVPDSQPVGRSSKPLLPGLLETSFDKTETWKKRTFPLPEKNVTTGDKQKPNLSLARASHPDKQIKKPRSNKKIELIPSSGERQSVAHLEQQLLSTEGKNTKTTTELWFKTFLSARVSDTSLHSDLAQEDPDVSLRKETANPKQSKTKPKSKEMADAAKSLISKISDRYRDKSDVKSKARDSLGFNRDDVYNFNISGFDEPTIKLGIQELRVTELSVHTETNKKGNTAISKSITEGKGGKKTRTNRDKKHLFSDSDTENKGDDSKTEISWLQESKRKPKAQIIDYSRSKKSRKPKSTDKTNKSSEPTYHMDKAKGKNTNKKKVNKKPQDSKTDEMLVKSTRKKLPRRAAATKNYKEPSSSESESEEKTPTCTSREKSKTQKYMNGANKDSKQPKAMQIVPVEPLRVDSCVQKTLVQSRNSAEQKEVEMPSPESPASLETMRCRICFPGAERVSGDVSPEHSSSERSLGLQESTPEDREMLNSERATSPSNFCPQNESLQSLGVTQSPETAVTKLAFGRKSFSPVLTEASLLSLTTYKTVSGKNSKGAAAETCNNNEDSSFQHRFSDTFSAKGKLQDITKPIPKNKEELSLTTYKADSGKRAKGAVLETGNNNEDSSPQSCFSDVVCAKGKLQDPTKPLTKRPSVQTFHKRTYHSTTESSSDEAETSKEEEKKGRRRISLQPKKLFKTDDAATCRVSESVSTQSVNDLSGLDGEFWKPDCSTISICQQLQKELTKKIEARPFMCITWGVHEHMRDSLACTTQLHFYKGNRSRKMDNYNKQTLRAAHQHLATMSYQLHECRIKQLDEFHFTLTEELEKFEKDSQSLKIMEKEFLKQFPKGAPQQRVFG